MRIAFVTIMAGAPWGGSEFLWAATAKSAIQEGHEVLISIFDWSKSHPKVQELIDLGAKLHTRRRFYIADLGDKVLNRMKFEVYHRKIWKDPYGAIRRFDPDVLCISQGGSTDLVYDGVQRLITESKKPVAIISHMNFEHRILPFHIISPLQQIFYSAKALYFICERNREVLERQICMPLPEYELIGNPLNLESNGILPSPSGNIKLACVGRLECDAKGQDILIQVLADPVWKERNWELSFFGAGRDEAYLRMLVKAFGLEGKVKFRGHVQNVADIWKEHHILLMPSLREGTPLALIEAMACGRPSVVTDVAGNAVYCREGETGFLAEAPNVRYFGAALERAWAARLSWEELGRNGFAFYNEYTDKDPAGTLLRRLEGLKKD